MTLQEALSTGGMVTVTGIIIVFSVLVILMLVMMAMKKVFYKEEKPKQETVPVPVQTIEVPKEDPNLIAVLTAAVAASLNTSTYNLNIKSYRRVSNNAPAWNRAGINDVIDSRF